MSSYFEDACLLPCDVLQSLSKDGNVINSKGSDSCHDGLGDNIRAVISSTNANLEYCGINLKGMSARILGLKSRANLEL